LDEARTGIEGHLESWQIVTRFLRIAAQEKFVGNGALTGLHHPRHDSGNAAGAPALQAAMLPTDRRQRTGASVVISAKVNKLGSSIDG